MKVVIINHSDTLGGASVVSFRLMEALRAAGVDARMLVGHKNSQSPFVEVAGHRLRYRTAFLSEHLEIFLRNGLSHKRLFQSSIATAGLPLSRHPLVREADAVLLNWVNQGLLSLDEIGRITRMKPTVWTMHDMWNMTGVCHHAGSCARYKQECGRCQLLGACAGRRDLSHSTWKRKSRLYADVPLTFVAVSNWLRRKASESSLLGTARIEVIPNAFPVEQFSAAIPGPRGAKQVIVMGAARLDDPVKGLPIAVEALNILGCRGYDTKAKVVFFGAMRDPAALNSLHFPYEYKGMVNTSQLKEIYAGADIVMSSSLYETLPGTLVEGQAAGCYPVTFGQGGQSDIIDHPATGYIAPEMTAEALADGLEYALTHDVDRDALRRSVEDRFSAQAVAQRYIKLIGSII